MASTLNKRGALAILFSFVILTAGCSGFHYDLSSVPIPVSAKPAETGATTEHFHIEKKTILWVHGLLGESNPDVAELLRDKAKDGKSIANLRVKASGSFHDWLLTHLTLTMMRMKTVVIEGDIVR